MDDNFTSIISFINDKICIEDTEMDRLLDLLALLREKETR